jgi:hypothetical protein
LHSGSDKSRFGCGPASDLTLRAGGPTADLDTATFDAMSAGNVRAAHQLVGAPAPGMAARGRGAIIGVDSMAGRVGLAGGAAYGASKAALTAMTRAWAAKFDGLGRWRAALRSDPDSPTVRERNYDPERGPDRFRRPPLLTLSTTTPALWPVLRGRAQCPT